MGRWDKWIVDQVFEVPSIFFFIMSYRLNRALKTLFLYFCTSIKNRKLNWKGFCKEFCKILWKKITLGTLDAWSTKGLSYRPSEPVYYILDCWISSFVRISSFSSLLIFNLTLKNSVVNLRIFPHQVFRPSSTPEVTMGDFE